MGHTGAGPEPSAQGAEFPRDRSFYDETLFYSGQDGFVNGTLPFIRAALMADEPDRGSFVEPLVGRIQPPPITGEGAAFGWPISSVTLCKIRSDEAGSVVRLHMRPT